MNKTRQIIFVCLILLGVGILLYPSLSQYLYEQNSSRSVASYDSSVLNIQKEQRAALLAEAQEYNRRLADTTDDNVTEADYWNILNIDGNGMMGHITIPQLSISIPIYHGLEESVLQVAVGHMPDTSLPVGGETTHAVLSGHTGLPTASLFTNLDRIQAGDQFYIKILDEVLAYEVDQIVTVEPHEVEELAIVEGQDYVTLLTCTPYGINTHRLLVRGYRVPYTAEAESAVIQSQAPVSWFQSLPIQYRHLLIGVAVLVSVLLIWWIVSHVTRRKRL